MSENREKNDEAPSLRPLLKGLKDCLDAGGSWAKLPPGDHRAHTTLPELEPEILGRIIEELDLAERRRQTHLLEQEADRLHALLLLEAGSPAPAEDAPPPPDPEAQATRHRDVLREAVLKSGQGRIREAEPSARRHVGQPPGRQVKCPTCGADPGQPCRLIGEDGLGTVMDGAHRSRKPEPPRTDSVLPPRHYAAAILETGQLQVVARLLRTALDTVEARKRTLSDLAVGELDRQAPEHAAVPARIQVVAHLNRDGTSLCGLPAEHLVRGLGVVEWRDLELRDPDAVFDLCQVCAKSYRATAAEDGKACTLCRGNIPRCPRCAGLGRYPKWAAEELEAGT